MLRLKGLALGGLALGGLLLTACGGSGGALEVSGSTTVNPVAADAAEVLREQGLEITVDTQGGSAGGIAQLGQGEIDIAMSSKPVGAEDRERYPESEFVETRIGADAVGIVVRREVVEGGLRSLGRAQLRRLFEGEVESWSELGGPDLEVFVLQKEPGRGTREVLDELIYGEREPPPPPDSPNYAIVGANEEGRSKLLSTPGGVTPLSIAFIEGREELAALRVEGVAPTPATIADGGYPLSRPLSLLTDGPPTGDAETFIDLVVSDRGQRIVGANGYLTLDQLGG